MSVPLRVLVVEDVPADAMLMIRELRRGGYDPDFRVVQTAREMRNELGAREWDVILGDYHLPSFDGFAALEVLEESGLDIPFIIVSGSIDQDIAVAAMRAGAHDYLLKDNLARLVPAVRRENHEARMRQSRRRAEQELSIVKEELALQLSDMTCLHQLGVRLSTTRELQQVVDEILTAVTSLLNTPIGVLMLFDSETRELTIAAARGIPEDQLASAPSPSSSSASAKTVSYSEAVLQDLEAEPAAAMFPDAARSAGCRALYSIPLLTRSGEILGCIETYLPRPAPPAGREARLMELYARQAGEVLHNVRLYEQVQELYKRAQEANRLKDEFVAMVSHELRTPLTPIMGAVHMIRTRRSAADFDRALEMIERNVRIQAQIIEDLLDVSRIASGKLRLRLSQVDLAGIVEAAVEAVRPVVETKNIHLDEQLSPVEGVVLGDPDRLQQVVWNLLSNAAKFTPPGGAIGVSLRSRGNQVEIRVSDTGVGIPPEFLPHVFDRFRQADSSITRAHGGLGLGLSIVRQLVELHGGMIEAESPGAGRGSAFIIHLPMRLPEFRWKTG